MAGQGAFVWGELCLLLNTQALVINFPNRKPNEILNSAFAFSDYVKSVIQQIQKVDFEELIIVTNSIGGAVGLKVAKYFGGKVVGFVGLYSAIPQNGSSFVSCLPFPRSWILSLI